MISIIKEVTQTQNIENTNLRIGTRYLATIYFHMNLRYGIEVSQINQATDSLFSLQVSQN
jgi:hypothetical protein